MNLLNLQKDLRETVIETAKSEFNIELEAIASEVPPKIELGDVAFPVAFELAKRIKQQTGEKSNPRAIAERLKSALEKNDSVERVEVAGAGYLNVFFNRAKYLIAASETENKSKIQNPKSKIERVCVEHTSVNPNKAAHIGHVRNSVLGDTFVRILRANGKQVEVQNYIDNTGVQVADVVVGFLYLENKTLEDIKKLDKQISGNQTVENADIGYSYQSLLNSKNLSQEEWFEPYNQTDYKSFDYYCWDLYAKVGQEYQKNDELKAKRAEILHAVEAGDNPTAELADYVATRNVECILNTMERFDIRYDLLPRESEILHLHFWSKAFEEMKQRSVIHFVEEGKLKGCWVMPTDSHSGNDEHEADKILVRSNGTVTYTGKDIAYQMWKLGLLGLDFYYKKFQTYADGKEVWITTANEAEAENAPEFGNSETVYNVIDSRQSYPQEVVKKGVATIFPERGEAASVHLSYEMVALSPAAAEELGFEISDEDKQKSFIEMSGRKGLGVKADDLLNRMEENAFAEVAKRNPDFELEKQKRIARQIAVGALRYFLLKFTRNTVIVFDFKEALSFDGETGVYCQNAAVRFNSIFKKLEENALENARKTISENPEKVSEIFASDIGNEIWSVAALASRLEEIVANAAAATEPAVLAKYNFNLSKAMHLFHHNHRIISEENAVKRAVLIVIADLIKRALTNGLGMMGIEIPERM